MVSPAAPAVFREWGDGATDTRHHVIEECGFGSHPFILCRCGTRLMGATNELLSTEWRAHGGQVLRMWDVEDRNGVDGSILSAEDRATEAVLALVQVGQRCTCDNDGDIYACPNYIPGDEEPLSNDD